CNRPYSFCSVQSAIITVTETNTKPKTTVLHKAMARLRAACLTRPSGWPKYGRHVSQHQNNTSRMIGTALLARTPYSNGVDVESENPKFMAISTPATVDKAGGKSLTTSRKPSSASRTKPAYRQGQGQDAQYVPVSC